MSDNFQVPLGTQDGPVIALDDIGGVNYQRVKMTLGADGVTNGDVSSSNPLPIAGSVSVAVPAIQTTRLHITGALTDSAVITPASGKKANILGSAMGTANSNTGDMSFRIGCGLTNTPTTAGVFHAHPGLPNNGRDEVGNGGGVIDIGTVDYPIRITCSDPGGSADLVISWYEN